MSDTQYSAAAIDPVSQAPHMTQMQRVVSTFTAPSRTFNDIKLNTSWWLPFVLSAVFGYVLFGAITAKVTWPTVAENNVKMSSKQAAQMDKMPPEQRASSIKIAAAFTEGIFAASPILSLVILAIIAGVLMATINFGFGGKATFWQVYAVCWFASLPGILKFILGSIALLAGMEPDSFKINNFSGTNLGYYLPPETSKPLLALASSFDVISIWTMVLMGMGLAIVAGTRTSKGYLAVFGWWIITVIVSVGSAAAFS